MASVLTVPTKQSPFPYGATALAAYTGLAAIVFDETATALSLELNGQNATNEDDIISLLAKEGSVGGDSAKTPAFLALATNLRTLSAFNDIVAALDSLDDHLAYRTYLVGHDITAADWAVWGALKGNVKVLGLLKNKPTRSPCPMVLPTSIISRPPQTLITDLAAAKASKARNTKAAAGFALGLQGAVEGQVVTRFPPEPSGYLHIGHAKAALLNQYFAQMYKGKMIIRFDDTNPSKERSEFEETILEDLQLMGVHGDQVTHTSDYFDKLYELAVKMIKDGKAYADDTEKEQMQKERFDGIASKHRDDSIEDNLKHFEEMKTGSTEGQRWCIRAKLSYDNPNKALRDPVIYRCNTLPHHRTGDAWKIYPTYDFACPVVDSLEGVTHALRTNEYRDRNPQYLWMIKTLGLRKVNIWDFSRLNFVYTLLSKRKLHWFVDNKHVSGWDDPRFPTVRGIRRRGMTVEALKQFMLLQGPSQAAVSLEWDSIWALNKKIIDPIAPRHWAILKDKVVPVTVNGGPATPEIKMNPKHKKNPEIGQKKTIYSSNILIEQADAASFEENEEITLMDWGNAIVRSKEVDASGTITSMTFDLHLEGDFKTTKKKITWLPASNPEHPLPTASLVDFDYLITKKKLEENDKFDDFVTPVTEFKEEVFADVNILDLKKGDIMQFERKGYYIYDGENNGVREFFLIPDGRASSVASKAATAAASKAAPVATPAAKQDAPAAPVSRMYEVEKINADIPLPKPSEVTKMYEVDNIHH
ncbi:hypothetical protein NMY22_g4083 [Coprinellus aureogranulatus]|nr:hypothetical protein NMY22_g4083 [Coprinellus aureogranulatus]